MLLEWEGNDWVTYLQYEDYIYNVSTSWLAYKAVLKSQNSDLGNNTSQVRIVSSVEPIWLRVINNAISVTVGIMESNGSIATSVFSKHVDSSEGASHFLMGRYRVIA